MSTKSEDGGPKFKLKRLHKFALNTAALGAFVTASMAASAPIRSDHPATIADITTRNSEHSRIAAPKPLTPYAVGKASWYGLDNALLQAARVVHEQRLQPCRGGNDAARPERLGISHLAGAGP